MYRSFEIRNFRCFHELKIDALRRVNLIAGVNNIGKTALLEALFVHCGAFNPGLTLRLNAFRGIDVVEIELAKWGGTPWDSIFADFETFKTVELVGENEKNVRRVVRLKLVREPQELERIPFSLVQPEKDRFPTIAFPTIPMSGAPITSGITQVLELEYEEEEKKPGRYYMILDPRGMRVEPLPMSPPFPAFFQTARMRIAVQEEAKLYGNLVLGGQEDVVLQILKVIEPRIRRIETIAMGAQAILHGDIGIGRPVPLVFLGDGMGRLTDLVLHIANARDGVVLIDEVENGLHHSVMSKVWRAIGDAALQFNTQVFATTHSFECIAAAHTGMLESKSYDFRLHRLERIKEIIEVVTYDQESLESAIETGLEVR